MIVKKNVSVENESQKLNMSKKVSTNLSDSLQLLNERFISCTKDIDTSEVEDVNFINGLIVEFNSLIEIMSKTQRNSYKSLDLVKLTDEFGVAAIDDKLFVVGEFYIENNKPTYYKRRIVKARTPKEAIYKYKKVDASLDNSLTCLGEKDSTSDYSLGIENEEIID